VEIQIRGDHALDGRLRLGHPPQCVAERVQSD
jgi:hypothetical protein